MVTYEPIVAWDIERRYDEKNDETKHLVLALTLYGNFDEDFGFKAIKRPDGMFEMPYDGMFFATETDLIAYFKVVARERKAPR